MRRQTHEAGPADRARVHIRAGRASAALQVCDAALRSGAAGPERADLLHLRGIAAWQAGDLAAALEGLTGSLQADPSRAVVWTAMARLQRELGRTAAAIGSALTGIKVDPGHAEAHAVLGDLFQDGRRPKRAAAAYERALALRPDLEGALAGLAGARGALGDALGAAELYERLSELRPGDLRYLINRAVNLVQGGDGAEAARVSRRALRRADRDRADPVIAARAIGVILEHDRTGAGPELVSRAERAARDPERPWSERATLLSILGRHAERVGDPDRAMRFWSEQTGLAHAAAPYHRGAMDRFLAETGAVWTPDLMGRLRGLSGREEAPILILGMPRSGTTLVEQILAQHPEISPGGELYDLGDVAKGLMPDGSPRRLLEIPADALPDRIRRAGSIYADGLDQYRRDGARVTDKMPENFKLIGIAAALMPNLRVIHMRRDPRDVCFSIWRLQFDNAGHTYGNRFEDLAHYYRVHEALIAHWSALLPGVIHTVPYEALVADPEGEGRRLTEHCGLSWSADQLDFSGSGRGVRTASTTQVREGLNARGIGRWRPYASRLAPMFAALEAEGLLPPGGAEAPVDLRKKAG